MEEANNKLSISGTSSAICSQNTNPSSKNGLMTVMNLEEFEVLTAGDNRAFCMAVSSGNAKMAKTMLQNNPDLAEIMVQNWMFPIHIAASGGHRDIVQLLYRNLRNKFDNLPWEQQVRIFFTTLKNCVFEVPLLMLRKCPKLADSRDEEQLTALHVLAQIPPEEFSRSQVTKDGLQSDKTRQALINALWEFTKRMERNEMLEFINKPSGVLFDAAKLGNLPILEVLLKSNPELLMIVDSKKRSLFHIAVLYRQNSVLLHMINITILKDLVMQAVDEDRNNILHIAGMLPPHERFGSSRADLQMQRELLWFKEVEKRVPTALRTMRNKEDKTPKDIFHSTHRQLIDRGKNGAKDKANYGMLVATIIATIVFAASLTVPGPDISPEANSSILQKKSWYIIFILSNSVALFSSSSSIIFFLSVLTSSFKEDEFISSLQLKLMSGVTTLFVAITTMMVAFTAACFLIFNHHSTWVARLVASLAFSIVALFVLLLHPLFEDLIRSLYWSRHLFDPTNFYQHLKSPMIAFVPFRSLYRSACSILSTLSNMCQHSKTKKRLQEDNAVAEP